MKHIFFLFIIFLITSCNTSKDSANTTNDSIPQTDTSSAFVNDEATSGPVTNNVYQITVSPNLVPFNLHIYPAESKIDLSRGDDYTVVQSFKLSEDLNYEDDYYKEPENFISATDFNFDGYDDLMLLRNTGSGGQWYDIYLFDANTGEFKLHEQLSGFTSPSADAKNQTVSFYDVGGMAGAWYNTETYKWAGDGMLLKIREEDQTSEDQNAESNVFFRTISLYGEDGNMHVASYVRISKADEKREKHCLLEGEWTEFDKNPRFLFVNSASDVIRVDGRNGACEQ